MTFLDEYEYDPYPDYEAHFVVIVKSPGERPRAILGCDAYSVASADFDCAVRSGDYEAIALVGNRRMTPQGLTPLKVILLHDARPRASGLNSPQLRGLINSLPSNYF